ncbi:MerR family transcriptional regulator [Terrilactibacillus laevilacticus]|uniref:MerR family transcriptional regulator n=1 Tax=Terrilactibacillus laevilacticus TaxID=1380157 RepID=A0ABW5PSJ5_9BACI|nr:MerR family transcriptional regulator [Terrilactibacillus laevilacticus]
MSTIKWSDKMSYSIGTFAEIVNLSIDTLRYYEKEGLIIPERDEHNRRTYTEKDREWIAFILRLKETAMPIKKIKEYARLRYEGDSTMKERRAMLEQHRLFIIEEKKKLEENLKHLDKKILTYHAMIDKYEKSKS